MRVMLVVRSFMLERQCVLTYSVDWEYYSRRVLRCLYRV
jgi:hypothetical protein